MLLDDNYTFPINTSVMFYNTSDYEFDEADVLECPNYTNEDMVFLESVTFWVDGVVTCILAFTGLIANIISALILGKEDMRNSFNFLLIALICMDSCYLVASILESFRKGFGLTTTVHIILFPYLFYPLLSIAVTGSIFMTVAIAFERYIAVHYPIDYSQAINSPEACRRRLFKYVVPVVLISTLVNLPKFFESRVETSRFPVLPPGFRLDQDGILFLNDTQLNRSLHTEEEWVDLTGGFNVEDITFNVERRIAVTDLRKNPHYTIYYNNWTRLFVIGIIPYLLLIYFNYKIYKDVKHRNRRQMSMSRTSATATQQARRNQEDNLAVVFMGIVLVFLVCHTPRNLLSLAEMVIIRNAMACQRMGRHAFPVWTLITAAISHMLLVVNSSTNMILYIFLNKLFRIHFLAMVKCVASLILSPCRRASTGNNNDGAHHPMTTAMTPLVNNAASPNPNPERNNGHNGGVVANGAQEEQKKPEASESMPATAVKVIEATVSSSNANNNSKAGELKKASAKIARLSVPGSDSPSPGEISAASLTTSLTQSPQSSTHQVLQHATSKAEAVSKEAPEAPPANV